MPSSRFLFPLLSSLLLFVPLANAHGALSFPPSRQLYCYNNPSHPACPGPDSIITYDWAAVGRYCGALSPGESCPRVPDGELCSGGDQTTGSAFYDVVREYASTEIEIGVGVMKYKTSAEHGGIIEVYITTDSADLTRPLIHADLELICEYQYDHEDGGPGDKVFPCAVPARTRAKQVVYVNWRTQKTLGEQFMGCADVTLKGLATEVTPEITAGPTPSPVAAPQCVALWGACGGQGHQGATTCCGDAVCDVQSQWYSQCIPAPDGPPTSPEPTTPPEAGPTPAPTAAPVITTAPMPTVAPATTSAPAPSECAALWGKCGGSGFAGPSQCCGDSVCEFQSEWYSQCVPGLTAPAPTSAPAPVTTTAPVATQAPSATAAPTATQAPVATSAPVSGGLADIVSEALYKEMFPEAGKGSCAGGGVFSYQNFLTAAAKFPLFGNEGSVEERTREVAAFFGQTSQETSGWWSGQPYTWGYCFNAEVGCTNDSCKYTDTATYPASPSKGYFGRGAMQLSWNYNYAQASAALFNNATDLIADPDRVASDGVLGFETALWFWMTAQAPKPAIHDVMVASSGRWAPSAGDEAAGRLAGYGMVTNVINGGLECGRATPQKVENRVRYYERYAGMMGVSVGENLYCDQMRSY
mmetsp:Transcript_9357/g.23452  ORF Transcript_9357/g.23452 Transcript_9357/m.23452 type:complete len:641 (-) Transcript_9357:147-2069(-)